LAELRNGVGPARYAKGICSKCHFPLSMYNETDMCASCQEALTKTTLRQKAWRNVSKGKGQYSARVVAFKKRNEFYQDPPSSDP